MHELRGLSLYLRFVKTVKVYDWPRLSLGEDRCHWLKYDVDAINVTDECVETDDTKPKRIVCGDFYASSTDSDCEAADIPFNMNEDNADPYSGEFD